MPSSAKDAIVGWLGDSLKVKVQAPPEQGRANAAVIKLLSSKLGIDQNLIEVVSGHAAPLKLLAIHGWDDAQIRASLKDVIS